MINNTQAIAIHLIWYQSTFRSINFFLHQQMSSESSNSGFMPSTATRTAVYDPANPATNLLAVNMSNITRLTNVNYLMWSRQIQALLEGHELHSFLEKINSTPEAVINNNGLVEPNPAYAPWRRQDRLLYSAIIGAISLPVQPLVASATTTHEVWSTLNLIFGTPTRGHIKQLKYQIKSCTKGTKTISEYMRTIKTKSDELALLGKPLDAEDLIEQILAGLPEEYKSEIDAVNGRDSLISFSELTEKLLNREAVIVCDQPNTPSFPVTANAVSKSNNNNNNNRGPWKPSFTPRNNNYTNNNNFNSNNGGRGPRPYLGRCQACGIQGHSAQHCPSFKVVATDAVSHANNNSHWRPMAHTAFVNAHHPDAWLMDSGASHHVTSDMNNLASHVQYSGPDGVVVGNGATLPITHTGSLSLKSPSRDFSLNNVLYAPSMQKNLISVNRFCKTNKTSVEFFPHMFQVKDLQTGTPVLTAPANGNVYEWPPGQPRTPLALTTTTSSSSLDWHHRLGHPAFPVLQKISSSFSPGFSCRNLNSSHCNACSINKSHKLPFHDTSISSSRPLQVIFSDVWSSPIHSFDGFKYYLLLVDHFTRYMWFFPLKLKSQVAATFIKYKQLVETQFNTKITTLYTDNGGEFIALRSFLADNGISHLTTPPHTPEHNGLSERRHRHIVETGLALLTHASIPTHYWTYALAAAVYLINRMPTKVLSMDSPYLRLFGASPNYSKLRVFGCLCYPWLRPYTTNKLQPRSTPCVFLGYSLTQSAYLCFDPTTSRMFISRHVLFVENKFPFTSLTASTPPLEDNQEAAWMPVVTPTPHHQALVPESPTAVHSQATTPTTTTSGEPTSATTTSPISTSSEDQPPTTESSGGITEHDNATALTQQPQHQMVTRSQNQIVKPNPKYCLSATLAPYIEPNTIQQALADERWRKSACAEFNAAIANHTWDLVPAEEATNIIGNKWLFRIKFNADGTVDKLKTRLVGKGFHQRPGIDYHETFSPVIKSPTIRLLLGQAAKYNWPIKQLDINNAFLQGTLTEDVYMVQPSGFIDRDRPNHVCKLNKALYGLKQAPRAWYTELKNYLLNLGFKNSIADASLFFYIANDTYLFVLIYVDDIIITGNSDEKIRGLINTLSARFSLKDLGDLSYFLGIEVLRTQHGIHLSQQKYIGDLLYHNNMTNAKPVPTPMSASTNLSIRDGHTLDNPAEYRTLVGSLQYLLLTRPDIAFAVNKLSQFMHKPTTTHWTAAKRVLRYLAGTYTSDIFLSRFSNLSLHAYSDADWAGNKDDYTSTGAYVVFLGQHPISWSAKKQTGVARSSTEAEYRAVSAAASEVRWLFSLLREVGVKVDSVPTIYCDNVGATYLSANPVFHSRMKHLALDYHFIREQVQKGTLRVTHVSSKDQLADGLTKPLPRSRFGTLFTKIGITNRAPS